MKFYLIKIQFILHKKKKKMAENLENLLPVLQRQKDNTRDEDDESIISSDLDNTQDFSRIKEQMTNIATQVENSISDMTSHMQQ